MNAFEYPLCERKLSKPWTVFMAVALSLMTMLATYITGLGLLHIWVAWGADKSSWPLEYVISGAMHLSWILCAVSRRSAMTTAIFWTTSLYVCSDGIATIGGYSHSLLPALLIESMPLLLARSLSNPTSIAEQIAAWRRARTEITVQLSMGEGVLHWLPECFRHFFKGLPQTPVGSGYHRFVAELADAQHRLHLQLTRLALPEQLRQSILDSASMLIGHAEKSAAKLVIDLELEALQAASVCRDQCEELEDMEPQQKKALAKQCEEMLLDLVQSAQIRPALRS